MFSPLASRLLFSDNKIFYSDWIAVNVLRNVALSTNSVAASVEPMMHQQYFSLSPMAGQESFGALDVRPSHMMAQTPTTSSMLAALQQEPFPVGALDSTSSFGADAFGSMSSYMDTSVASQEDALGSGHQSGLNFPDFSNSSNPFDSTGYTSSELGGLNVAGTPSNDSEQEAVDPKSDHP